MVEALTPTPLYIRNPDVVLREEDQDGGLLFNPDTNQIRVLNATGLLVWQMCDGGHALSDFVDALRDSFDGVPEEQVGSDVERFVQDMQAHGFIGTLEQEPST